MGFLNFLTASQLNKSVVLQLQILSLLSVLHSEQNIIGFRGYSIIPLFCNTPQTEKYEKALPMIAMLPFPPRMTASWHSNLALQKQPKII